MYYKPKSGQTVVQRIAPLVTESASEVLELRHTLCGNRKICVRTDMLSAHLTLSKGEVVTLADGTLQTTIHAAGKLLYQPVNGCGVQPFNGCNPCNPCGKPCPEEDVIFASFKVYSLSDITIEQDTATAQPITHSHCQDFTDQVLIVLPYAICAAAAKSKAKKAE